MKIISGGQTGADQAGLIIAKELGFKTGGWAPKGWITSKGSQKQLLKSFGLQESTLGYRGRTHENVRNSNATIRFAVDFNSPGEICTLEAINSCKKPWIDIDLLNVKPVQELLEFLILVKPNILNIAGNTQNTKGYDIENFVKLYLKPVLKEYKRIYLKD